MGFGIRGPGPPGNEILDEFHVRPRFPVWGLC